MHQPTSLVSPEMSFARFDLVSFGSVEVPAHPLHFGFQVDIIPESAPHQIMFGLVSRQKMADGKSYSAGFAIHLDLTTGEVWDLLNDNGLLGIISNHELFFSGFSDEEPMLLEGRAPGNGPDPQASYRRGRMALSSHRIPEWHVDADTGRSCR